MEPPGQGDDVDGRAAAGELLDATRQRGSQLQLRNQFVARDSASDDLPPAVGLLRRSHKNGLQLRLALTYFWLAGVRTEGRQALPPYTVALPVRLLTSYLGFDSGDAGDRRRIRDNTYALAQHGLVRVSSDGQNLVVALLRDASIGPSDTSYYRPGESVEPRDWQRDGYITLPRSFFVDGWLTELSPSGLATLLAFRYLEQTRSTAAQGLFISDRMRRERFGFSERTYYAGSVELVELGLMRSWSQHVKSTAPGPIKTRRVFAFRSQTLIP